MENELHNQIIERVKLITGKTIEFKNRDFETGTTITIDDVSMILTLSHWIDYKKTINYYEIDIVADFSNVIINKFKLKTI